MAIPAVIPYPMPCASEIPRNRVAWKLDAMRCALLIHDMQRYFLNAFTPGVPPLAELIANITLLRRRCADLAIPVFYSVQPGAQNAAERGLLQDLWGAGIGAGSEVVGVAEELSPGELDTLVLKRRYSAFHRTILLERIRKDRRDQLIICGVYAHIGCLATALEAFMNDIQPFMVADAVADFSAADHAETLAYAARCCAVIFTTRQMADMLCPSCKPTAEMKTPQLS